MDTGPRSLIAVLRHSHERLASLSAFLTADQLTRPSYASEWTIAQVFSHLGSGAEIAQLTLGAALSGGAVDREKYPPIWDAWNAKAAQQQAADCIGANDAYIGRLERLTDSELAAIKLDFLGMNLDAAGLIRLRLNEHALHTWDIAVAVDPAAVVAPDAVAVLTATATQLAGRVGRPPGEPLRVRLRTSMPDQDLLLATGEGITIGPSPAEGPADVPVDAEIRLPSEALIRLLYGRLDPAHTPPVQITGDGQALDRLRAVFPGF